MWVTGTRSWSKLNKLFLSTNSYFISTFSMTDLETIDKNYKFNFYIGLLLKKILITLNSILNPHSIKPKIVHSYTSVTHALTWNPSPRPPPIPSPNSNPRHPIYLPPRPPPSPQQALRRFYKSCVTTFNLAPAENIMWLELTSISCWINYIGVFTK